MKRVLDASVAIAWYLPEAYSASARRWREEMLEGRVHFVVPSLHLWEVGNALRTYVRRGEIAEDVAREIYHVHLDAPLEISDPAPEGLLGTALKYDATLYDAVYIAVALQQQAPLLTAEKSTTPWVTRLGKLADTSVSRPL